LRDGLLAWIVLLSVSRLERAMVRQPGFFDVEDRLKRLSDLGDQLEAFSAAVDFEIFRPRLDRRSSIPMERRAADRRSTR
jgi:hypothetical protein